MSKIIYPQTPSVKISTDASGSQAIDSNSLAALAKSHVGDLKPAIALQGKRYATFGHSAISRGFYPFDNHANTGGLITGVVISGGIATFKYNSGSALADVGNYVQILPPTALRTQSGVGGVPTYNYTTRILSKTVVSGTTTLTFKTQGIADGTYDNTSSSDAWSIVPANVRVDDDAILWIEAYSNNPSSCVANYAIGGTDSGELVRALVNAKTGPSFDRAYALSMLNDINGITSTGANSQTTYIQNAINTCIANHVTWVKQMLAWGVEPIVIVDTMYSSSYSTDVPAKRVAMAQIRQALLSLPRVYSGCIVLDGFGACLASDSKYCNSQYPISDGYHPATNGACAIGWLLWNQLKAQTRSSPPPAPITVDDDISVNIQAYSPYPQLISNPCLTGAAGGSVSSSSNGAPGTGPTGWTINCNSNNLQATGNQSINLATGEISNRVNSGKGCRIYGSVAANSSFWVNQYISGTNVIPNQWYRMGITLYFNATPTGYAGMDMLAFTNNDVNFMGGALQAHSTSLGAGSPGAQPPTGVPITFWSDPFFIAAAPSALSPYFTFYFNSSGTVDLQISSTFLRVVDNPYGY